MAAEFLQRMGERMRERREQLGLSRPDVARLMPGKVSENQIYRWELGKHQPNPDTLEALARVLKTDVAAFMAPEPEKNNGTPVLAPNTEAPSLLAIQKQLAAIQDQLEALKIDTEAHALEVLRRLDEGLPPRTASQ